MRRAGPMTLAAAALFAPAMARAATLDPGAVFANAAPLQKLVILGLAAAGIAAVIIAARKIASGPRLAGGSAFISGLRYGAPIAGVFGGVYALFRLLLGVANVQAAPTLKMLAPGLAEAALIAALGLLCGVVAAVLHWTIESRLDREVLRT